MSASSGTEVSMEVEEQNNKKRRTCEDVQNSSSTIGTINSGEKITDSLTEIHVTNGSAHFEDFSSFKFKGILSNSADYKRAVIEAVHKDGETAVIILDKKPFTDEVFGEFLSGKSTLRQLFQNDIYGSYDCSPIASAAEIKSTVIYPATAKHVDKYSFHPLYLVQETPEIYEKVTLPHIQASAFTLDWVYNVLEHKKEADRIVYEDSDSKSGFILAPDLKWDGKTLENLYLTAIVHDRGIKSIRELTPEHLPLLENILENGSKAIVEKYGIKRSQLRIYLHYHPSYYHLHVHFNSLFFSPAGIHTEKAHLLTTVIDNIKGKSSYYQEATLPFTVKENDRLYKSLVDYGYQF